MSASVAARNWQATFVNLYPGTIALRSLMKRWSWAVNVVLVLLAVLGQSGLKADTLDFERDIVPILVKHCLDCHQPNKRSGKLNLSSRDGLLAGGEQGPAFDVARPRSSLLLERVVNGEMPPPDQKDRSPLSADEKHLIDSWINVGA